jgi:formate dehydrogenase assembly factor FdhD
MEKQNDSMRERLLARLPQPENLAAYREETASLLAKHEKALFWEKMLPTVVSFIAIVMAIIWWQKIATTPTHFIWLWVGFLLLVGAISDLRYRIYRSRVDTLKEVKQVQLQILELQAFLQTRGSE